MENKQPTQEQEQELKEKIAGFIYQKCDSCNHELGREFLYPICDNEAGLILSLIKEAGYLSPGEVEKRVKDTMYYYLDIANPCPACGGRGKRSYASTATWHGGIGGQMITTDICNKCWGSGDAEIHWTNLHILQNLLTPEQKNKYAEINSRIP